MIRSQAMRNVEVVESCVVDVDLPPLAKKGDTLSGVGAQVTVVFEPATGLVTIKPHGGAGPYWVVSAHRFLYLRVRSEPVTT